MKLSTKRLVWIGLFTALTAIFSQIAIPLPFTPIPVNLATLAVLLCGAVLGVRDAVLCQLCYVFLGAVGIPVFAKFGAGIGTLVGPTGGYILGYILAAALVGFLALRITLPGAMLTAMLACYLIGTLWFMILTGTTLLPALISCVIPFLPGDVLKIIAAILIAKRLNALLPKE